VGPSPPLLLPPPPDGDAAVGSSPPLLPPPPDGDAAVGSSPPLLLPPPPDGDAAAGPCAASAEPPDPSGTRLPTSPPHAIIATAATAIVLHTRPDGWLIVLTPAGGLQETTSEPSARVGNCEWATREHGEARRPTPLTGRVGQGRRGEAADVGRPDCGTHEVQRAPHDGTVYVRGMNTSHGKDYVFSVAWRPERPEPRSDRPSLGRATASASAKDADAG
jgi:hypothetical protein